MFPKILKDTFVPMLGLITLSTLSEDSRQRNVLTTPTKQLAPADKQDQGTLVPSNNNKSARAQKSRPDKALITQTGPHPGPAREKMYHTQVAQSTCTTQHAKGQNNNGTNRL